MITKSQKVLLMAIRAALFGTKPSYPADTDWDEVVKEAKAQTVLGIISPVIPVHDESVEQGKANYMRILYEQDQLIKLFDEHDIPCVILKGTAAAIYYPKPYLRAMGDVDILVPRNKFFEAKRVMKENGYKCIHKENDRNQSIIGRHIEFIKNGIEYELHHHFSSIGFDIDDILEKAISKRVYHDLNGYRFPILPNVENGLIFLGHINQHLRINMLGLRQIVDWELYFQNVMDSSTWNKFASITKKIGLYELAVSVTKMCENNLGLKKPIHCECISNDLSDELISSILTDGNFGRREILFSKDEKTIRNSVYSIKENGLYWFFQGVGLNRWTLCKKYPSLKPFAFIYGFVRCSCKGIIVFFKTKDVKQHITEGIKRIETYRKLGIKSGINSKRKNIQ